MSVKRPSSAGSEYIEGSGLLPTPSPDEICKKSRHLTGYEYPTSTVYNLDGEVVDRLGADGVTHLKSGDRLEIRVLCTVEQLTGDVPCTLLGYRLASNRVYSVMYWPSTVVVLECNETDADVRLKHITTFDREYLYKTQPKLPTPVLLRFTPQMAKVANEALNRLGSIRIVVVGNKDVGKSTFLRFLLNQMLTTTPVVQWLDLDPGQCEFTPAGLLSLVEQREPLFGPPHHHVIRTHLGNESSKLIRSYYIGHLSPSACSLTYKASAHALFQLVHDKAPLLVNTMGWMSGIGLYFLDETIQEVKPDFVVHLISNDDEPVYQCSYPVVRVDSCSAQCRPCSKPVADPPSTPGEAATTAQVSTSAQQRKARECRDLMFKHYFGFRPARAYPVVKASLSKLAVGLSNDQISLDSSLTLLKGLVAICCADRPSEGSVAPKEGPAEPNKDECGSESDEKPAVEEGEEAERKGLKLTMKVPPGPLRFLAYGSVRAITDEHVFLSSPVNFRELDITANVLMKPTFTLPYLYE